MGIKKIKYRKEQKERNKKFMFKYEDLKFLNISNGSRRKVLRSYFDTLDALNTFGNRLSRKNQENIVATFERAKKSARRYKRARSLNRVSKIL